MGIRIEFNPDLCLRDYTAYESGERKKEECLPSELIEHTKHTFLKSDQRMYWLDGELPLRKTDGNGNLSRALASIRITEVTHFKEESKTYTKGIYEIIEVFNDDIVHFDGLEKIT